MRRDQGQARWQAIWRDRGWQARLLWPLSRLYGLLISLRRSLYAHGLLTIHQLPVPVVVVGNVVMGGAGKTPTVLALLHHLKTRGWHPGVVSRGHGRRSTGVLEVTADTPASDSGDEPALVRRNADIPVFVGAQRAQAARALLKSHPEVDVIVCDDGLQHLALGRDLSIAVFDSRGTGNGWLLPAGLLRERWPPRKNQSFQPDIVLQQSAEGEVQPPALPMVHPPLHHAVRRLADHALGPDNERLPLADLRDTPLTALAGIALPEAFFAMLRARGLHLQQTIALPDHADDATLAATLASCRGTLVCTEKDAVKLFALWKRASSDSRPVLWTVPLELRLEPAFFDAIDQRLARPDSAP